MKRIAIIGRPNVGKSALFNAIIKKNKAIVHHYYGVTRDELQETCNVDGEKISLIDSAGIDLEVKDKINKIVQNRIRGIIDKSDGIIVVVDGRAGLMPDDFVITKIARKSGKPCVLFVNKCDTVELGRLKTAFFELGVAAVFDVSAFLNRNITTAVSDLLSHIEVKDTSLEAENKSKSIKIAVVGKPNVGKSSFINKIINDCRCIVFEKPGTTRDSVDVNVTLNGANYKFIDTAGLRRTSGRGMDKFLEVIGMGKTKSSIKFADVILLLIGAQEGICSLDKKIFRLVCKEKKPVVLVVNKWDLVNIKDYVKCSEYIDHNFSFMKNSYKHFVSSKSGKNVMAVLSSVHNIVNALQQRIPTPKLNVFIKNTISSKQPSVVKGKRLNIYYGTQISSNPFEFIFFVNNEELLQPSYEKYMQRKLIDTFNLKGIPISFKWKRK